MGFFDMFKGKSKEEEFQEAIENNNFTKIVNIGKQLLKVSDSYFYVLNPVVDALVKLGRSKEAVDLLNEFSKRKIKDGYYDTAIVLLKKSLRIDPYNIDTVKLLSDAYLKKELYYEAFTVLENLFETLKNTGKNTKKVEMMIERFVEKNFHPYFYDAYGDLLFKVGDREKAFQNYVLAGNMYANIGKYSEALSSLLKARRIRKTQVLDSQIIEVASKAGGEVDLLKFILLDNKDNQELLTFFVKEFISADRLEDLEKIISTLPDPTLRVVLETLKDIEIDDVETAVANIEKLKLIKPDLAGEFTGILMAKHPDNKFLHIFEKRVVEESLPSSEELLESILDAIDIEEGVKECDFGFEEIHVPSKVPEVPESIDLVVKKIDESVKFLSMAEAMFGIENFDEALKYAKEALSFDSTKMKAAILIANIYSLKGDYSKALNFLFDLLKKGKFSENEEARLKEAIGEIYEKMGEKEKAIHWYVEANKVLNDADLKLKIEKLK